MRVDSPPYIERYLDLYLECFERFNILIDGLLIWEKCLLVVEGYTHEATGRFFFFNSKRISAWVHDETEGGNIRLSNLGRIPTNAFYGICSSEIVVGSPVLELSKVKLTLLPTPKTCRKKYSSLSIHNCLDLCTSSLHLPEPQSLKMSRGSFMLTLTLHNIKGPL